MQTFKSLDMKEIAIRGHADVIDHFQKEAGPSSSWANTKRGGKILQDTGRLKQSIRTSYSKRIAQVRTNMEYAATHNFGFKKKNIPQREFMYLSKKAIEKIKKRLLQMAVKP